LKFTDLTKIKNIIDEETEKVCGNNKSISNKAIHIKFYSKNVVDLLLVDLPGMTKNPVGE